MTYFHIRLYTIIGAKSFHCPVRDGKEWDQLAMVVRHNLRAFDTSRFPELAVARMLRRRLTFRLRRSHNCRRTVYSLRSNQFAINWKK